MYKDYGPVVYRRAYVLLRDRDAARDAMQEVFVKVVEHHGTFKGDAPVLHWMYRITTNLCLNRLRRDKAHPVVPDPDVVHLLPARERGDGVDRMTALSLLARTDALTQAVVVHYYLDEMTTEEVAQVVGKSRKTVGKKLERFRKRARAQLEER